MSLSSFYFHSIILHFRCDFLNSEWPISTSKWIRIFLMELLTFIFIKKQCLLLFLSLYFIKSIWRFPLLLSFMKLIFICSHLLTVIFKSRFLYLNIKMKNSLPIAKMFEMLTSFIKMKSLDSLIFLIFLPLLLLNIFKVQLQTIIKSS